ISNYIDISKDSQNIVELPSGDETLSTKGNSDNVRNVNNQQTRINENRQLYQNAGYDDNDLRRDVSQYRFGDDNNNDQRNITNGTVSIQEDIRSNNISENEILDDNNNNNNHQRDQWSGRFDFFFATLGYAVGLGAVLRFPYLCYRNGGGVFLIPYIIFLFFLGIPLFYLEVNLGQFTSQGATHCWRMAPIFKGLGISMSIMSFFFTVYYTMLVGYSVLYFILSFRKELQWATCGSWANCISNFSSFTTQSNYENTYKYPNDRFLYTFLGQNLTEISSWNITNGTQYGKPVLPSDDYFNNYILNKSEGIDFISTIDWRLVLCLLGTWILIYVCLCGGVKISGKIVYFTSVFPYVILLILGIRGWILPGMSNGIYFYMKPDLNRLGETRVWNDAANQIFFILSVTYGGLITLSSYNKFNQSTLGNTLLVSIANVITSIFAGFVMFAYLGYLAHITGQNVQDVVSQGPGLAFIVYPYAVTTLPVAPLWSILFFFMLILLGLDSVFASIETVVVTITDQIQILRRYNALVTFIVCTVMFGLGLLLCTNAGFYWLTLLDNFTGSYAAYIIGLLECICIAYVYEFILFLGSNNFRSDVEAMLGSKNWGVRFYFIFQICWSFITPLVIIGLIVFTSLNYPPLEVGNYTYPLWANNLGWALMGLILSGFVLYAIYAIIYFVIIKKNSCRILINPQPDWGPLLEQNRKKVNYHYGEHDGYLVRLFDKFKKNTLSKQKLDGSNSIDVDNNGEETTVSNQQARNQVEIEFTIRL
ncbi:unnamed protein product, partial [Rotaria sp. Silwood2]